MCRKVRGVNENVLELPDGRCFTTGFAAEPMWGAIRPDLILSESEEERQGLKGHTEIWELTNLRICRNCKVVKRREE
ncbi:unnamed protein product [Lampetra planeri]